VREAEDPVTQIQAGGPPEDTGVRDGRRGPGFGGFRPARVIAGVLLVAGIVLPLWVPSYARDTPRLWGFPFFYWYQLIWVFIAALLVGSAFLLVRRDERLHRNELTGGIVLPERDALEAEQARGEGIDTTFDDGRPA
jgi:hypothetical protein